MYTTTLGERTREFT